MKTKVKYPFVYFFIEPNVVFVYKIETDNYLTTSELGSGGEWETFELNHADEFVTFDHRASKPLEGRGYLVREDDTNFMVTIINKQIQKHRNVSHLFGYNDERFKSFHIVSSEYAAGPLKIGLDHPKRVIAFPDFFSIGPIWRLDEKIGQSFRYEWLNENINSGDDDFEYETKFTNTLLKIEDIPDQVPIYIWYGNNAEEQTGVYLILQLFQDTPNEIHLINTTELYHKYISQKDDAQLVSHTGQIESGNLKRIFDQIKTKKPLSFKDRIPFQREWQTLAKSKEILRLWVNGELTSVPEHHYDTLIINTLKNLHYEQVNKDFIQAGKVIGETIILMEGMISHFFLEYRMRHLVYSGVLELKGIPKSMSHYSVKLRS
ncbi:DUF1835 domain-containing protein [Bacillus sp. FSL K6-3431]|uniref:DUF1835 domain-containing protein n=1 Tax=Bacillus sp. FSL K6-3431 TaxID=2921500 RepID=UPI0030F92CC0